MQRVRANGIPHQQRQTLVRRALVQAAWASARINRKRTFFSTLFYRISSRAGAKQAAVTVAHRLLCVIYSMILTGSSYRQQGVDHFDRLHPERIRKRLAVRMSPPARNFDGQLIGSI